MIPEGSGVIFALVACPYGFGSIRSPPANSRPFSDWRLLWSRNVWHHWQVPICTRYAPRFAGVETSGTGTGAVIGVAKGAAMWSERFATGSGFRTAAIERR